MDLIFESLDLFLIVLDGGSLEFSLGCKIRDFKIVFECFSSRGHFLWDSISVFGLLGLQLDLKRRDRI